MDDDYNFTPFYTQAYWHLIDYEKIEEGKTFLSIK